MNLSSQQLDGLGDTLLQVRSVQDYQFLLIGALNGAHQQVNDLSRNITHILEELLELNQDRCG